MQQSEQEPKELTIIKKQATLTSIPENVALLIAERVKGWVEESKTFQEKEKARKARDSTLRAIALSCKSDFHFYIPALLQNVTIDATNLNSIQNLLQRENYGHLFRSLHFKPLPSDLSEAQRFALLNDFAAISSLSSSTDYRMRFDQGFEMPLARLFRNLSSIETLIIEPSMYIDGLFFECHAFLTNSLKKIYISAEKDDSNKLSARNGKWLLLFVPQIQEAALAIDVSILQDFRFLLEFGDTIEGLSRVSKLSLHNNFIWEASKPKTWWGLQEEHYQH